MFILLVSLTQSLITLAAVGFGAWLFGGIPSQKEGSPPPTPAEPDPHGTDLLPTPHEATVGDIQRGMTLLTNVVTKLQTGSTQKRDYEEAHRLSRWILEAGRAAEKRLAHQIERQESQDGRMDQDTALALVERGIAQGVPHRTLATLTGWSKGWIGEQSRKLASGS